MTDGKISHTLSKFNDLQNLLEKQTQLLKRGNISGIESLARQANSLIDQIARAGLLEPAEFADHREKLKRLYDDLHMAIAAQQADVSEKISRVRKGRKTIQTYRNNV
jgi:flagellar biosynthesis/type III secretory pathway chaperone